MIERINALNIEVSVIFDSFCFHFLLDSIFITFSMLMLFFYYVVNMIVEDQSYVKRNSEEFDGLAVWNEVVVQFKF